MQLPLISDIDPTARQLSSSGNIIDDIIEGIGNPEIGKNFKKIIEDSNFLERQFDFPGAKKTITGQEILQQVKGVGISEKIPSLAAYEPLSGKIYFNPSLPKQLMLPYEQAGLPTEHIAKYLSDQTSFTTLHELGHVGANIVGIDDIEKRGAQQLGKQMPESMVKHIGEQEKIADSFAESVFKSVGKDSSKHSYLKAIDAVTGGQEAVLGRELTVEEILQVEGELEKNNINPKSRIQLASYLEGDVQSEKLQMMSQSYDSGKIVQSRLPGSRDQIPKHLGGTLEPGAAIPQNIPQQPHLPPHLTAPTSTPAANPRPKIPLGQPVQAAAPTPTPTSAPTRTTKPVGRPVISASTPPPPPTGAGAQKVSAQVTHSGNATTRPAAVIKNEVTVAAKDIENVGAKTVSHEAGKTGAAFRKAGDDISRALLDGTKGTRNIKLLGAAALIGAGGFLMSKKTHQSNRDYDRQLEMQRRRNIM